MSHREARKTATFLIPPATASCKFVVAQTALSRFLFPLPASEHIYNDALIKHVINKFRNPPRGSEQTTQKITVTGNCHKRNVKIHENNLQQWKNLKRWDQQRWKNDKKEASSTIIKCSSNGTRKDRNRKRGSNSERYFRRRVFTARKHFCL